MNDLSYPSKLKITDLRYAALVDAPMPSVILRIETNQGIVGYGEVRDFANPLYALMLKQQLLGENPCQYERLFRKIVQYGAHGRQGGGVSGVEIALLDLAGKAYGVPVYQLLGGKYRDRIPCYCDTHAHGENTGANMGLAMREALAQGFSFLKMNLKPDLVAGIPDALCVPAGVDIQTTPGALTRQRYTGKGLDALARYVGEVRDCIGYGVPLAIDHIGHFPPEDVIELCRRLEPYNLAWLEDPQPWMMTTHYERIARTTTVPLCTGEDIYLAKSFLPLLECGAVSVVHPDPLTVGGLWETKRVSDLAREHGVSMAIHMAGTAVASLASVHAAAACENFLVLEYHAEDVAWWDDVIESGIAKPIIQNGFIPVPDGPGLGIEALDDEILREHANPELPDPWASTEEWNHWRSRDKTWS